MAGVEVVMEHARDYRLRGGDEAATQAIRTVLMEQRAAFVLDIFDGNKPCGMIVAYIECAPVPREGWLPLRVTATLMQDGAAPVALRPDDVHLPAGFGERDVWLAGQGAVYHVTKYGHRALRSSAVPR